jgi:hypothetical protein
MAKTEFEQEPSRGSALFRAGYLDGARYRRCRIGLPQGLLDASDDYAQGLRAGYGLTAVREFDGVAKLPATLTKT